MSFNFPTQMENTAKTKDAYKDMLSRGEDCTLLNIYNEM